MTRACGNVFAGTPAAANAAIESRSLTGLFAASGSPDAFPQLSICRYLQTKDNKNRSFRCSAELFGK